MSQPLDQATEFLRSLLQLPEVVAELRREVQHLRTELASFQRSLPPHLTSVSEAARQLGVSQKTVRRKIATGELASLRLGTAVRVDLGSIRRAVETGATL